MEGFTTEDLHMLGVRMHQSGRHADAVPLLRRAVELQPAAPHYHLNLGLALAALNRLDDAIQSFQQAAALHPGFAEAHFNLGRALLETGRPELAIASLERSIALNPQNPLAPYNLGCALEAAGRHEQAVIAFRQAIALQPNFPEAYFNLANAMRSSGQTREAIEAYRQAIRLRPDFTGAVHNLAIALGESGQFDEALATFERLSRVWGNSPQLFINYGNALRAARRHDDAIAAYQHALRLNPASPNAHASLGTTLRDAGLLDQAIESYRRALELEPNHTDALNNLGNTLREAGRVEEGIECYRRSLAVKPDPVTASNLLASLYSHPGYDAQRLYEEHARWNEIYARPLARFIRPHPNNRSIDRRLRVGYVSPDLNANPVGRFLLPLLAHHDHDAFEIVCYSDAVKEDDVTRQLRAGANVWRDTAGLSHAQLADLVRGDAIDLLVDLSLHGRGNRLLMFAMKPAPVQVSYLAYCGTTGLQTMDYRFSDRFMDPPGGDESCYSERTIRLPGTYWCYQPPPEAPQVTPLPALAAGRITFGCLNNFFKVTPPVVAAWCEILRRVPNSRLLLHAGEGSHRDRFREQMGGKGISPDRIQFVGFLSTPNYFAQYQQIDIALDPFPFPGGTTTCDALWSGVPVITLAGGTAMSRAGLSILSTVGLSELVAHDSGRYVQLAAALAGNLDPFQELRSTLRQKMIASPLMNAPAFAADVEACYRWMWQSWAERMTA